MTDRLIVRGAREHNLKNVSLDLPRDSLIVFTGLSGSGKSSLAFDTIFAEGQRRYVESLSSYARQFLGQMDKPDVDFIEGLSPAVSIDQKSTSRNPRSTVGTITEVYDYLRLLFARIGKPHCPECRMADLPPVAAGHRRPGPRAPRGQPLPGALPARPRTQGRVRRPLRRPPDQGLQPRPRRRRDRTAERTADAEEAGKAHDRGSRRPPHREGQRQAPPHRLRRDRARTLRRHGRARLRRPPRGRPRARADVLGAPVLPVRRPVLRGARAALLLLQLALRRLPRLHRHRHPDGGRPGADRPGRGQVPRRGRHPPLVARPHQGVLRPASSAVSRRPSASARTWRTRDCRSAPRRR